jgi:hypothetical protein
MKSTKEILKYIEKHPKCDSTQLAKDCFNNDEETARDTLNNIKTYIHCKGEWDEEQNPHTVNIFLSIEGERFLLDCRLQERQFWIPSIMSAIVIFISLLNLYFDHFK